MSAAQAASRVLDMARILRGAPRRVVVRATGPPSSQRTTGQTNRLPGVDSRLERYAQLVVRTGVNVQPGQTLLVEADVEHTALARAIADEAYAAGAGYVDVLYRDPWLRRSLVAGGPDESLELTPAWMTERVIRAAADGSALIGISSGSNQDVFEGLDLARVGRARHADAEREWLKAVTNREISWALIACPTARWAQEVLGEPDVDRLWEAVAHALRLDEPDPAAAWNARLNELDERTRLLDERAFKGLRYRGPGTDFNIALIPEAKWMAGRDATRHGQAHVANLPTEEVFTSPHKDSAEGTVRSSMPLALRGGVVEGLELTFSGGVCTDIRADKGADLVRADMDIDEGGRRVGEIALVDSSSRIGETGIVFKNTLFDENAAAHIAWGDGISWTLGDHSIEEAHAAGMNESDTHTDFMVGCPELEVDGVAADGTEVPILREGRWLLKNG
jgi:aminopeptidase